MPQKILIIQTAWLGDNILTTPLVSNAARIGAVDVLTTPKWASVYEGNPDVSEILIFDKRGNDKGIFGLRRMAGLLRSKNYDVALIAQRWWRSAILAKMAKIPKRIGFSNSHAKRLYTGTVEFRSEAHEAERLLDLLSPLGTNAQRILPKVFPQKHHMDAAQHLLQQSGWRGERILAIAPASAWETKRYPYFHDVAEFFANQGIFIVTIGAKEDYVLCADLVDKRFSKKTATFGGEAILTSAALLSISNLLIANDSGAGHLASAVQTPVISIFGPTVPEQGFYPLGEKNKIAQVLLKCRPCSAHGGKKCPLKHHKCMKSILPGQIIRMARDYFESPLQNQ